MEQKLKDLFLNVNDWLKFAETKNAVMLTVNGAGFFVCLQIINSDTKIPVILIKSIWFLSGCLLLSILVTFVSFLPDLKIKKHLNFRKNSKINDDEDNLLFYIHISLYTPLNYLSKIYKKYTGIDQTIFSNFELDLAKQIINNSKIATRKFSLFKIAIYPTIIGITIVFVSLLILFIKQFY